MQLYAVAKILQSGFFGIQVCWTDLALACAGLKTVIESEVVFKILVR